MMRAVKSLGKRIGGLSRFRKAVLLVLLTATVVRYLPVKVGVQANDYRCLEHSVYLMVDAGVSPVRGQLVTFRSTGLEPYVRDGARIIKQVGAVPGDTVSVVNDAVYVNGQWLGDLTLRATLGHPPGGFDREVVVPPDHIAVFGTTDVSYDSRYWGLLPIKSLEGRAYAIF